MKKIDNETDCLAGQEAILGMFTIKSLGAINSPYPAHKAFKDPMMVKELVFEDSIIEEFPDFSLFGTLEQLSIIKCTCVKLPDLSNIPESLQNIKLLYLTPLGPENENWIRMERPGALEMVYPPRNFGILLEGGPVREEVAMYMSEKVCLETASRVDFMHNAPPKGSGLYEYLRQKYPSFYS